MTRFREVTTRIRGRKLQERNARLRRAHPLCVKCYALGIIKPVDEFDHIVPLFKGGKDAESNLQGLCFQCHIDKTNLERPRVEEVKGLDWIA